MNDAVKLSASILKTEADEAEDAQEVGLQPDGEEGSEDDDEQEREGEAER